MSSLLTRILVATDGSEDRALTVCAAADLSGRAGAELSLVYVRRRLPVMEGLPQSALFERAVAEYVASYDEETGQLMRWQVFRAKAERADAAGTHLREGRPAVEIVDVAEDLGTDLVVVGSRGLGTVKRLVLGSVSERLVSSAPCPILVARGS